MGRNRPGISTGEDLPPTAWLSIRSALREVKGKMNRCAALDFPQFPPLKSLARREADTALRLIRRFTQCTAGTAPLHLNFRKAVPPPVPQGEARSKKQMGCRLGIHSLTAYGLLSGGLRRLFVVPFFVVGSFLVCTGSIIWRGKVQN